MGAVAKGYAAQQVCDMLPEGYMLNLGGNVCATGAKPNGENWSIGIQNPLDENSEVMCVLSIDKGSVVTSGDYQRYYTVNGKRYNHIIDTSTLMPGEKWSAVTVICMDSAIADGLSTALFLTDRQTGEKLLSKYDAQALWVTKDGNYEYTSGFEKYLAE